jgi:energy-coupling factor transport system permease protein
MDKAAIDPRTRLLLAVLLTTLAVLFNSITASVTLLLATALLCMVLGRAGITVFFRAKWLIWFFVLMAVIQSVFNPAGRSFFSINDVTVLSAGGLALGVCFLCRMAVIIFSAGILAAAGSRRMIQGLIALRLPYELAFMTTCALSFLPMIAIDMKDSLTALELRGIELKKLPIARKVKVYNYLIIPVLEGIMVKAKELSCAMEMRAFRAYNKRTSYVALSLSAKDYAIMALSLSAFAAGLLLYF